MFKIQPILLVIFLKYGAKSFLLHYLAKIYIIIMTEIILRITQGLK